MDALDLLNGIILGLLGGLLVFYSVRTEVPYPKWVIQAYEEPIIRIVLFVSIFALAQYDSSMGVLATLIIVFLHTDITCLGGGSKTGRKESFVSRPGAVGGTWKEGVVTGLGSRFGHSMVEVVDPQIKEGTIVRSPLYPLSADLDEPSPGDPLPLD